MSRVPGFALLLEEASGNVDYVRFALLPEEVDGNVKYVCSLYYLAPKNHYISS